MRGEATLLDEPHHHALELLAAKALAEKEYAKAFEFSDRRCRIKPAPQPHCYLLRAEASLRMGKKPYAIADLDHALELGPDDTQANRRMLAWSKGERQRKAARALLANERDIGILRRAIDILGDHEPANFASMTVLDETIEGWVVWNGTSTAEVSMMTEDNVVSFFVEADPHHPLSSEHHRAANFSFARPKSHAPQSFAISAEGRQFFSFRAPGNANAPHRTPKIETASIAPSTIIIPVYADFAATKACLESVLIAMQRTRDFRVLLVDDAAPDSRITNYLRDFSRHSDVELLTNPRNLGFVGSINRALKNVRAGDVILLNADTIVPPGFVDRLAAAARSASDIGTVVPLSNNGEFSSFPIPNEVNDLGSYEDVVALDKIAAATTGLDAVDVPSGIGFCLYITRACLNAVGSLSENYQRGYLEDVDFCLRAREHGFRSVCAPSVYVGHEGSRSFKSEKRSLVARNLQVLDGKFPNYRQECSAFVAADPLRPAREAIERALPYRDERPRIIVAAGGALRAVAEARVSALLAQKQPAMTLEISNGETGPVVRPIGPEDAAPQNIRFALSELAEQQAFEDFLKTIQPSGFEIIDPAGIPTALLDTLIDSGIPYDVFIADAGLFFDPGEPILPGAISDTKTKSGIRPPQQKLRRLAEGADHMLLPCPMAEAFASRHLPKKKLTLLEQPSLPRQLRRQRRSQEREAQKLGILAFRASAEELTSIRALSRAFLDLRPDIGLVVIGSALDDLELIQDWKYLCHGIRCAG